MSIRGIDVNLDMLSRCQLGRKKTGAIGLREAICGIMGVRGILGRDRWRLVAGIYVMRRRLERRVNEQEAEKSSKDGSPRSIILEKVI